MLEWPGDVCRLRAGVAELAEWRDAIGDRYPLIMAAFLEGGDPQGDTTFEDGLDTIIAGLRVRLTESAPPARP